MIEVREHSRTPLGGDCYSSLALSVKDSGKLLKEAAEIYKVNMNAVAAKIKQEFAAKDKAKAAKRARAA
jgi:hypothetical protein